MTASTESAAGGDPAIAIEKLVDGIAASPWRSVALLLLLSLICFLPGFGAIAPIDRDEPLIAEITKLMVQSASMIAARPENHSAFFNPPGINWLQAAAVEIMGGGPASPIWIYRLPSLFGAIGAVLLTWWAALAFGKPRAALLAAAILAVTPLLTGEARLARPDAILLAMIVLGEGALARLWLGKDRAHYGLAFLFWTALGIGILMKGPVAPAVLGLTVIVLCFVRGSTAWLKRLMPVAGGIWLLLLVSPWLLSLFFAGSPGLWENSLNRVPAQETFSVPPGSHAVLFYPFFGPAGIFVALAIPAILDHARRPVFVFALAWVIPYWLLMELLPGKLPDFVLPLYPALAIVAGTAIDEGKARVTGWISTYFSLNPLVWPWVMALASSVMFFVAEDRVPYAAIPFYAVAVVCGWYAFWWFYRQKSLVASSILAVASALFIHIGLFGAVLADLTVFQVSSRVIAAGREAAGCDKPEFVATGFSEPSLVFYGGAGMRFSNPADAVDFLSEGGCRVALVERRRQSIFNQRAADVGFPLQIEDQVKGVNLGDMRLVDMRIFVAGAR